MSSFVSTAVSGLRNAFVSTVDECRRPSPSLPLPPAQSADGRPALLKPSQEPPRSPVGAPIANLKPAGSDHRPIVPDAIPYRKGAGVHVPPGTSMGPIVAGEFVARPVPDKPATATEIAVKAHVRNVPAEEKSLLPAEVTLEVLIAEFRRVQRATTHRVLILGMLCQAWIREQLEKRTALDRATAIKKIREQLAEAKLEKNEARVDLFVRCHWVAVLLGGWRPDSQASRYDSGDVAFSVLRLFPLCIERRGKTDTWQIIPKYAEAAKTLWQRAVKERLSAAAVNAELSKILPARTLPIRKQRPVKLGTFLKMAPRLAIADVPALIARLQEIHAKSRLPDRAA